MDFLTCVIGNGAAYLYDTTDNSNLNVELRQFVTDGNANASVEQGFGVGASIVSEGNYVVGTQTASSMPSPTNHRYSRLYSSSSISWRSLRTENRI